MLAQVDLDFTLLCQFEEYMRRSWFPFESDNLVRK